MTVALVVLSGGQDSCTCLAIAKEKYSELYTISFVYGQRHEIEVEKAKKLSALAGVKEHKIVNLDLRQISTSNLLNTTTDISSVHPLNSSLPSSFVPGRNMLFLTYATMWAYSLKIKDIYTGVCQTDGPGYPDCRRDTIDALQQTLRLGMDYQFEIHTPLMHLTKAQTVLKMRELGHLDWYKYTITCYNGQEPSCGICPACLLRAKGFQEAGIIDPVVEV